LQVEYEDHIRRWKAAEPGSADSPLRLFSPTGTGFGGFATGDSPRIFYGELSTKDFGLAHGLYSIPFGPSKQWNVTAMAASALVNYVGGIEQPGRWNSGVSGGIGYTATNRRWRMLAMSSYGIDAIRSDGRGGYSVRMMFQYNFGPWPSFEVGHVTPYCSVNLSVAIPRRRD